MHTTLILSACQPLVMNVLHPVRTNNQVEPEKEPVCLIVADVKNLQEQIQADTNDRLDFENVAPFQVWTLQRL